MVSLKKTKTKAFSNLIISIFLLIFEVWAYFQASGFRKVKGAYVQASTFPQIMDIGMMIFTVILLIQIGPVASVDGITNGVTELEIESCTRLAGTIYPVLNGVWRHETR